MVLAFIGIVEKFSKQLLAAILNLLQGLRTILPMRFKQICHNFIRYISHTDMQRCHKCWDITRTHKMQLLYFGLHHFIMALPASPYHGYN